MVGYQLTKKTSVYGGYYGLKDGLRYQGSLAYPGMSSLSWGVRRNEQLGRHTFLQFDLQAREQYQLPRLPLFAVLPGATLSHIQGNTALFASVLMQLQGLCNIWFRINKSIRAIRLAVHAVMAGGTCLPARLLLTNFGRASTLPILDSNSISMITDVEINHPLKLKYPNVLAFSRFEHVYNSGSASSPQFNSSASRFFTGVRLVLYKPAYNTGDGTVCESRF